jgi:antitoxin component YwqK of YwqJK toxin-antitoxin module
MKNRWLSLILLLLCALSYSQDFDKVFYNSKWEITSIKDATYYRISGFNPDLMKFDSIVVDRYMNNNVEMIGKYHNGIKEGDFIYYYPDQNVRISSSYVNNKRSGKWIEYYQNGQVHKEVEYDNSSEKLIQYNHSDGSSILKNQSGRFEMVFYYDSHFDVFSSRKLGSENKTYVLSGNIKNGYKDGKWTLKCGLKKICQLNYKQGNFIHGKYFINNTKQDIKDDIFSFLILEPEKLEITAQLCAESGQLIKENYLIRYIQQARDRKQRKIEFQNEDSFVNYFEKQYSVYVKNWADTFRIKVSLRIDADGKISITSISPNATSGHNKEIERIVNTVQRIKSPTKDSIEINHRVVCLEELSYKK